MRREFVPLRDDPAGVVMIALIVGWVVAVIVCSC